MSDLQLPDLPQLRPVARQGKAYYTELKAILKEIGPAITADAERIRHEQDRAFTVRDLCVLALRYRLNCKATCEHLEDVGFLPCGTYTRLRERDFRPVSRLKEVWAEMQGETSHV